MNKQAGLAGILVPLAVILALIGLYTVYHYAHASIAEHRFQVEADSLQLGPVVDKSCNTGDGVDSGPSCQFTYTADYATVGDKLKQAGYTERDSTLFIKGQQLVTVTHTGNPVRLHFGG